MTVIATQDQWSHYSSLVKGGDTPEQMKFFTDAIVVNDVVSTLVLGTVLGKVTATGKFKVSLQGAADGSQVPVAIYTGNSFGETKATTLVAATDTKALALVRGKIVVSREALKLDASFNTATLKQAAYDSLKAVGILVEASI